MTIWIRKKWLEKEQEPSASPRIWVPELVCIAPTLTDPFARIAKGTCQQLVDLEKKIDQLWFELPGSRWSLYTDYSPRCRKLPENKVSRIVRPPRGIKKDCVMNFCLNHRVRVKKGFDWMHWQNKKKKKTELSLHVQSLVIKTLMVPHGTMLPPFPEAQNCISGRVANASEIHGLSLVIFKSVSHHPRFADALGFGNSSA